MIAWLKTILRAVYRWLRPPVSKPPEPIKCATCTKLATVNCTWGLYEIGGKPRVESMQNASLCEECSDNLWHSCKPAVNAGLMHWVNKAVVQ